MRDSMVLLLKFVSCAIAFAIGLDVFFDATIVDILSFSLTVTIISYIIGDRIILPAYGNTLASLVDFIMAYLSVWIFGNFYLNSVMQIAWGSVISAAIISIAEIFVHRYLLTHDDEESRATDQERIRSRVAFGTEFAEENDLHNPNKKD
ncbi:MAG: YndM family protein [Tuberibacillus sp.]